MAFFAVSDGSGFRMHYHVVEALLPKTTLFIHGNLASNRWWQPLRQEFMQNSEVKKGAWIAAEFRGCGASHWRESFDLDIFRLAQDYVDLLRSLKLGPVNLVGHSTGGFISLLIQMLAPELVDRSVLLDPVGAKGLQLPSLLEENYARMQADKKFLAQILSATIYRNNPENEFFQSLVQDAFGAVQSLGSKVVHALHGVDISKSLKKVANPVLVLHGEQDFLLPIEASQELASLLPRGKFMMLPSQGHSCNLENPALLAKLLREFLF